MKYWHLIWGNLKRKKLRTLFTVLSILVAFVLFGVLGAINVAMNMGVELAGVDRLVLRHRVSLIRLLPVSYESRIESVEGVAAATHATWFGGIYQDPKNFFAQLPVEPGSYLEMYPEFLLPEDQKKAWLEDRTGAIVGRTTARRYDWKVGDRIPIQGTIWRKKDGSSTWEFTIRGIYDGAAQGTDTTQFLFRYDYFDEARWAGEGLVGWYVIRIDDPAKAAEIAERVDAEFANSPNETRTSTERAFVQAFANQVGNIGAIVTAVLGAVFFTILLVAGNTMMQSVRERTNELAVLKTVGYSRRLVLTLVLLESLAIAVLGGLLGLGLAWLFIEFLGWVFLQIPDPSGGLLQNIYFPLTWVAVGFIIAVVLGLLSGAIPAVQAMRLRVVDALRRT
jgi:putative ABC transport system permease protein